MVKSRSTTLPTIMKNGLHMCRIVALLLVSLLSRCAVVVESFTAPSASTILVSPPLVRRTTITGLVVRPVPWQQDVSNQPTTAAVTTRKAPIALYQSRSSSAVVVEAGDDDDGDDDDADDGSTAKTIQILMSDTGGGHRASAYAIRDALYSLYGGPDKIVCDIVDIYADYGNVWPYRDYPALYKLLASYPWSWALFYWFGATDFGLALNEFLLNIFCHDSFRRCLQRTTATATSGSSSTAVSGRGRRADLVVSVHPLTNSLPVKIIRQLDADEGRQTPFCTVVTDLGSAHPTWFCPDVDKCFVPTDVLRKAAKHRGLRDDQIVQHGLPIRSGFWPSSTASMSSSDTSKATTSSSTRSDLNLMPGRPNVLVVGGGDGMGGIVDIARALGTALAAVVVNNDRCKCQLTIVCGKNEVAKKELEQVEWHLPTQVLGFVNNMDEWMKASAVLVTKAGPGTIAEASICGLPCMMFSFLPGQEEGNIPFVEDSGFGKYSNDPKVIAETVTAWLSDPPLLRELQHCARGAARPRATIDIARDLAALLSARTQTTKVNNGDRIAVTTREKVPVRVK